MRTAYRPQDKQLAKDAIDELKQRIVERFPSAEFAVLHGLGEDRTGTYLKTTVDIDDPDEVLDVVRERMLELLLDQGIEVYVLPVRTPERIAREMAERSRLPHPRVSQLW